MKKTTLLLLTALGLGSSIANATPLLNETFSYPDGSLVGNGNWATHSGTAGEIQVSSGAILLSDSASEDANSSFTPTTSGTLFYGFDISVSDPGSYTGTDFEYFAHFKDASTDFTSRLDVAAFSSSGFRFGIAGSSGTADATWGSDLSYNQVHRVVVGFDFTSGISTLWVNPSSPADTSIVSAADTVPEISAFAFRQSSASPDFNATIDNLNVGTTFADAIPEPSTTVMLLFGIGLLARYFRKK